MSYIDTLIGNCNAAKAASPSRVIEVGNLSALDGILKAIYVIEEIGGKPEETFLAFSRYKGKRERACAKLNAPSSLVCWLLHHGREEENRAAHGSGKQWHICAPFKPLVPRQVQSDS